MPPGGSTKTFIATATVKEGGEYVIERRKEEESERNSKRGLKNAKNAITIAGSTLSSLLLKSCSFTEHVTVKSRLIIND